MLVSWSGGCDSTLVLFDLCTAQKEREDSGSGLIIQDFEKVRAISVFHDQSDKDKKILEARARRRIYNEFKKRGLHFESLTVHIRNIQGETRGGGLESAVWILSAIPYLLKKETFHVGYIREDDVWHDRDAYIKGYNGIQELIGNEGGVKFPLEWDTKLDVVKRLQDAKLFDLTWWCEKPKDKKPCGTCKPCYRMEAALFLQKLKNERAEKSTLKGLKKLKSRSR